MAHLLSIDTDAIRILLDRYHIAAATKNVEALGQVFASDAFFIGTDDLERWSRTDLLDEPERSNSGWDMIEFHQRSISGVSRQPEVALFFEIVRHKEYGFMRGSGAVIKESGEWRIAQYVLSFSIPNKVLATTNIVELLAQK